MHIYKALLIVLLTTILGCSTAGTEGKSGLPGSQGTQGIQGPAGDPGPPGAEGPQGPQGPKGDLGTQGVQGPSGQPGMTGAQGAPGVQGAPGQAGAAGANGVLSGRASLYSITAQVTVGANNANNVTAACTHNKDILLNGGCQWATSGMGQIGDVSRPSNADGTNMSAPSGWECQGYNLTGTPYPMVAYATCITVP